MHAFMQTAMLAIAITFTCCPAGAQDAAPVFRAGAVAMDITPTSFPISVNGGMSDHFATHAHDRLHARCLVLDDGKTRLAIAVCDSCMIPRQVMDEAKALAQQSSGIPADRMLISATHTHEAPASAGVFQSDADMAYRKYLAKRIAEGITAAAKQLEPARIGWAVGLDPGQVFNRRWLMRPGKFSADPFGGQMDRARMNPGLGRNDLKRPAGPTDPEVCIISVQARGGRPIALLANYSLHYVGGVPGDALSADYFAVFANRIGELIGADKADPPFVGIMSNGTSGDINNIDFSKTTRPRRQPYEQMQIVAQSVAEAALAAYKRVEYHDWVPLAIAHKDIDLGVRRPDKAELDRAVDILANAWKNAARKDAKLGEPDTSDSVALVHRIKTSGIVLRGLPEVYARESVLISQYPPTVNARIQAIRIGDVGIAAIPCEVFVQTGLAIKENSPLPLSFTIELANGYNGYLPTPQQHALRGYETWRARSAYLEVNAATKIYDTVMATLHAVAR